MFTQQQHINFLARITTLFSMVVVLLFFASCQQSRDFVGLEFDPESVPSMITTDVNTLISDSGITRLRMMADMWKVFDRATEPHWFFPEGLYVEQFDSLFNIEATIRADTAWNFTAQQLWRLRGNVQMQNVDGDEFDTEELYWNQAEGRIFSDKYIEIRQIDGTIMRGYGFESNQAMTEYRIFRPHDSRFPFVDNQPPARRFNEEQWGADDEFDGDEDELDGDENEEEEADNDEDDEETNTEQPTIN